MILLHSTLVILEKDHNISGRTHINNGLVVVEMEGEPSMEEIRDFIKDRINSEETITTRDCNYITFNTWAMLMANGYIEEAKESSKIGWIEDVPQLSYNFVDKEKPKLSKWQKFWTKGRKT